MTMAMIVVGVVAFVVGIAIGRNWSDGNDLTIAQTAAKAAQKANPTMRR